jgi:hypothetical protein
MHPLYAMMPSNYSHPCLLLAENETKKLEGTLTVYVLHVSHSHRIYLFILLVTEKYGLV